MLSSMVFIVISLGLFFGPAVLIKLMGGSEPSARLLAGVRWNCQPGLCVHPLWLVRKRVSRFGEAS